MPCKHLGKYRFFFQGPHKYGGTIYIFGEKPHPMIPYHHKLTDSFLNMPEQWYKELNIREVTFTEVRELVHTYGEKLHFSPGKMEIS